MKIGAMSEAESAACREVAAAYTPALVEALEYVDKLPEHAVIKFVIFRSPQEWGDPGSGPEGCATWWVEATIHYQGGIPSSNQSPTPYQNARERREEVLKEYTQTVAAVGSKRARWHDTPTAQRERQERQH